jgi:hypothetical protein
MPAISKIDDLRPVEAPVPNQKITEVRPDFHWGQAGRGDGLPLNALVDPAFAIAGSS